MEEIKGILEFMVEIEKLKSVSRQTKPVGLSRYENSAEHSWHVCLSALMLKDYANETIDITRVMKMLLIHDLGEIDAGDTIIYSSETDENKLKEQNCIARLFKSLPNTISDEYIQLWVEFEKGESSDAIFAKAIDRVPPLLHNIHGDGHSWKKHNISKDKVLTFNGERISKGSEKLWHELEVQLEEAVESGLLK
ncbi:HD domain-containing protein [Photobacterium phosphoreum]|jgi:putative hydrolase of HD superfamily|uniref:HD domain-containing protein n=1 Tax=Photobacterium phosphoreum TaxID=659 RepID=UPI0007F93E33|nr:HD domain-containing protein [Photobacterium phosphoreum]MCD9501539.1 HD domain-containing protein [Photobacterium phosphoreum]MCD9505321.1 HD domain-containing protein [Photobacterium phosphoreum]OBU30482.1 phosphohydrolase [Photobacterium phosphoreum]OBU39043.1 phosphohydrolase [Photobacterium phosphoreum]PSW37588.1 HD domain-containing protein [Photobacterium phosphoreum]